MKYNLGFIVAMQVKILKFGQLLTSGDSLHSIYSPCLVDKIVHSSVCGETENVY